MLYYLSLAITICCHFLFHARLDISVLACYYWLYHFHAILKRISLPVVYVIACSLASNQSFDDHTTVMVYMLCFSYMHSLLHFILRASALVRSHTVFYVVVMSSGLDYYLSCLYHCIAAEHIIHSDSMLSLVRNDLY